MWLHLFYQSESKNLKQHVAKVYDKKIPFKCEICDYTFARKGHVKKHVESFQEKKKSFKNVKFVDTAVLLNLTLTGISKQFMILWYVWSPPGIRA